MDIEQGTKFWLESASDDWNVAQHLLEKGDYPYALFFGHLTIEEILKALYFQRLQQVPPLTHRLVYLAEKVSIDLSPEQLELFETITDFNLEARYPDEKFSFKKRCTKEFTEGFLKKIRDLKEWLIQKLTP